MVRAAHRRRNSAILDGRRSTNLPGARCADRLLWRCAPSGCCSLSTRAGRATSARTLGSRARRAQRRVGAARAGARRHVLL